jgi:CelD/BcsL family acetyltransferase involved in cellulose biosynthesis
LRSPESLPPLAELKHDWSRLATLSGNVFSTWEWAMSWWSHFGRGRALHPLGIRGDDGGLVAILPLYTALERPVRLLRFVGHGAGDELGPVCAPAQRPAAAHALAGLADSVPFAWDLLLADDLCGEVGWETLAGARSLARRPSPVVWTRAPSWEDFLAARSGNFRRQLRNGGRRLERAGRVRYRVTADPARLGADLELFFALHQARWRRAGGSRAFTGREGFIRDFASRALARGWLRLRFLEVDERPIATLLNFRFGDAEAHYQAGRDPAFDAASAGILLHAHAIRETLADGLGEYRFLRGGEHYKLRFADHDPGVHTLALARTRAGRLALAALAAEGRLPRPLRRRIPAPIAWGSGAAPAGGGA